MSDGESFPLDDYFERWQQGDEASRDALCRKLLDLTYARLGALARTIFHKDFAGLRNAHETDSVVNEAALRLLKALRDVQPASPAHYFRLAALEIRRVLLDMARVRKRQRATAALEPGEEPADFDGDPEAFARWTEFHEKVAELPGEEREVVHLVLYLGLSQAEAARLLGLHPRAVSRLWVRAIQKLPSPELCR
jgi:RNA polymerase sigma-70 factor (ECF subfamily)